MTAGELKRWLKKQGCTFTEGKKHSLAHLNGLTAAVPRHAKAELPTGTVDGIKKQLGLK